MQQDTRSDEQLARAFKLGEDRAFDELYRRYLNRLRFYILKISWFKDDIYLEEVLQQIFIVVCQGIKIGKFAPWDYVPSEKMSGTFRRWIFTVARIECYKQDEKRSSGPVLMPKQIADALPDMLADMRPDAVEEVESHQHLTKKLEMILSHLTADDQKLFELKNKGVKYQDILNEPEFKNIRLGPLRMRYCRILDLIKELLKKDEQE
ncbi:MAG: hypothetical protein WC980_02255 [Candidatus Brocadiia bacterium]